MAKSDYFETCGNYFQIEYDFMDCGTTYVSSINLYEPQFDVYKTLYDLVRKSETHYPIFKNWEINENRKFIFSHTKDSGTRKVIECLGKSGVGEIRSVASLPAHGDLEEFVYSVLTLSGEEIEKIFSLNKEAEDDS